MKRRAPRILVQASSLVIATVICFAGATSYARASGTVVVRQNDGHVNTYSKVSIKIAGNALFLRSADKQGTLVIPKAACSSHDSVIKCYPTSATLIQAGKAGDLKIKSGTVNLNLTDSAQTPAGSEAKLPAHSISLSLLTAAGTHITSNGRIDEVEK